MAFPADLRAALADDLGAPLETIETVYGGDINQTARLTSGGSTYFLKWHNGAPPEMFPAEAHGLRTLASAHAIRVPGVIAHGAVNGTTYLLLEYIETRGRPGSDVMASFGESLAELHRHTADTHGLERDNFIGRLAQPNPPTSGWTEFYRDYRIGHQMAIARGLGRLPKHREDLLTRLMDRLPDLLDDDTILPSLLHGDLWGGNYLIDTAERAVLIDPAVYYGHREMDIAMTELFGGFSGAFYAAYNATYPLEGYDERRALYQLYYIIVHLNHFGESYGGRVDSLAAHYVGR